MTVQPGDEVILKIGDNGDPEIFTTIGGLKATAFRVENKLLDATCVASSPWRELLSETGIRSVQIQAGGLFTDSVMEILTRELAFTDTLRNYRLSFGNGDNLQGTFKIIRYGRRGDYGSEERYELFLESSGEITYTPA